MKGQEKMHYFNVVEEKVTSLPKKKIFTSENVTTSEWVDKGNKNVNDMK